MSWFSSGLQVAFQLQGEGPVELASWWCQHLAQGLALLYSILIRPEVVEGKAVACGTQQTPGSVSVILQL